jgi:hypothetical protein
VKDTLMVRLVLLMLAGVFSLSALALGVVQANVEQPQWHVVMYLRPQLRNQRVTDFYMHQAWMHDLNTGLRILLPFDYEDKATFRMSDDGSRVLTEGYINTGELLSADQRDLYIMKRGPEGGQLFLTSNSGFNGQPDAVDDLRYIVFISDRDSTIDVYTMRLNEDDVPVSIQRITTGSTVESDPQWLTREAYQAYLALLADGTHHIVLGETVATFTASGDG